MDRASSALLRERCMQRYSERDACSGTQKEMHAAVLRERCMQRYAERDACSGTQGGTKGDTPREAPLRGAIRAHQRPSEAIRGHQRPSEVIRGHQVPSEFISDHQWSSVVISGIRGNQCPSGPISGHQRTCTNGAQFFSLSCSAKEPSGPSSIDNSHTASCLSVPLAASPARRSKQSRRRPWQSSWLARR